MTDTDDWQADVRALASAALDGGEAFVPHDVAEPELAEQEARAFLLERGEDEDSLTFAPSESGLTIVKSELPA